MGGRLDCVFNRSVACLAEGRPVGFLSKREMACHGACWFGLRLRFLETGVCGVYASEQMQRCGLSSRPAAVSTWQCSEK